MQEIDFQNVSVVMGSRNEERAIEKVIKDIISITNNKAEIIVVDGSDDKTPEIAKRLGVIVIRQEPKGYGEALKLALMSATRDIIITTDCDDTYPMEDIPIFIKLIQEGYDVVSGSRLCTKVDAMSNFNRFGNRLFAYITSILYGIRITDATTGMRAYRKDVIRSISWTENVGLSAELLFRPALRKYKIVEVPINYRERIGETKLDPIMGGVGIFKSILKYAIIRK